MCFYLQQHFLNKEKKKPSPSCSASWGRAQALAESPRHAERRCQSGGFCQPLWSSSGLDSGGELGLQGLKQGYSLEFTYGVARWLEQRALIW